MNFFADKVAIVTGGASGLGRALGDELGQSGAIVILADVNTEGVREAAARMRGSGHRVEAEGVDVTDGVVA